MARAVKMIWMGDSIASSDNAPAIPCHVSGNTTLTVWSLSAAEIKKLVQTRQIAIHTAGEAKPVAIDVI